MNPTTSAIRFGEKIALHKTPNPPGRPYMESPLPLVRPDATETQHVMSAFQTSADREVDVVVLSSQKQALVDAGVNPRAILERSIASSGDQPDVILTEKDATTTRLHYKILQASNPDQAKQYADSVATQGILHKIFQELPKPRTRSPFGYMDED